MPGRCWERLVLRTIIVLLSFFVGSQFLGGDVSSRIGTGDFVEYWAAGRIFLHQGNPYDSRALLAAERAVGWSGGEALVPYTPPWSLPLFLPFSVLPFWFGRIAWFLVSFVLVIAAGDWCWRTYGGNPGSRWIGWLCALLFVPSAISLQLGQISPLLLSGILLFVGAARNGRNDLAGCAVALLSVKPHLLPVFWLVLLLWVESRRKWDLLVTAALTSALLVLATVAINPRVFEFYLGLFRSPGDPLVWQTPTWGTVLRLRFPGAEFSHFAAPTAVAIAVAALLWRRWEGWFDWLRHMPPILLASAMTAAYAWTFDWIILVPAVIQMAAYALRQHSLHSAVLLGALLLVEVALAIQSIHGISYFHTIWVPPSLALLYWIFRGPQGLPENRHAARAGREIFGTDVS